MAIEFLTRLYPDINAFTPQSLMESESLFKHLVRNIPEPVFLRFEHEKKLLFVNQAMVDLCQISEAELLAGSSCQFLQKAQHQAHFGLFDPVVDQKRYFQLQQFPLGEYQGQEVICGFFKDVSEAKALQLEFAENEKRWDYAQKASGECFWDWDLVTNQIHHSQHWSWLTEAKNRNETFAEFIKLVHSDDLPGVEQALEKMLNGHKPYDKIFRICPRDAEPMWVWDRGHVIEFDAHGKPLRAVGAMRNISDIIDYQSQVEQLAYFDHLTGLPNRQTLEDRLQQSIKHFAVSGEYVSILFLDLDKFKHVNDTHGHQMGDTLLKAFVERVVKALGPEDTLGRFAGDEFVVILNTGIQDKLAALHYAEIQAEKIHKLIHAPFKFEQPKFNRQIEFNLSMSVGIALCESAEQTVEDLMRLADLALYRAKEKGRGCSVIFNPEMQLELENFVAVETALKLAIDREEFVAFFQPKVSATQKVLGAEMLIRWQKPNGEMLPPVAFLQIAEETGLIVQIGCWMMRQALEQLQKWQYQPGFEDFGLAVNISVKQLQFQHFANTIISMIQAAKVNPRLLTLEITETGLMTNMELAIEQLKVLRDFGVRIAIDDFGTGYSSLSYLKRLPVDKLKIDRSFVNDLLENQCDERLVKTIIDIGQNFNLNVLAEGVEKPEQMVKLSELGCCYFQGYHFSRPVPLHEFENWVLQHKRSELNA